MEKAIQRTKTTAGFIMINTAHPSAYLQPEWIKIIRAHAISAEKLGSLHPEQLQLIYEQQWFKLFVPATYGGLETSLPEAIRLEEALSWADGSIGWTVTLCCGAGWFGGFLSRGVAKEIFANKQVCLGGSGAPSGTATLTENGYELTGRWKYATGAIHTSNFTANCIIKQGDTIVLNEDGSSLILPFILEKDEVELIREWNSTGLIATGSHSFEIKQLNVSKERCFKISSDHVLAGGSVYKYPFLQLAETTLAANISGMAIHFMDLCEEIFAEKISNKKLTDQQKELLENTLSTAKNKIDEARSSFYNSIGNSWSFCDKGETIPDQVLSEVSLTSRLLAKYARQHVDGLYPFCGLIAANPLSEINRVWRDLHTASQHTLLNFPY